MKYLRLLTILAFAAASVTSGALPAVHASGHGAEKPAAIEEIVAGVEVTLKRDLGTIEVINVEPTRGRTLRMAFNLHLTLDPHTSPKDVAALDGWHHRLREQVIIGVRATDIHDFIDPELTRFRKQMLYRINRLLTKPIVNDVLFANLTFHAE